MNIPSLIFTTIVVIGLLGCLSFAIFQFIKTPKEERYKLSSKKLEAKREEEIRSGILVEIKPQKKRAFLRALPWVFVFSLMTTLLLYVKYSKNPGTASIFGLNALYLAFVSMCYVMPSLLLLFTTSQIPKGIKAIKHGYFPPLDTISFTPTLARKGTWSVVQGYVIIVMAVFTSPIIFLGHVAFKQIVKAHSYQEFVQIVKELRHPIDER